MKRRKKKIKMNYGGIIMDFINNVNNNPVLPDNPRGRENPGRIPTTGETLARNDIMKARANLKSENNLTRGLDMVGNLAMTYGSSMMGGGGGKSPSGSGGYFDMGEMDKNMATSAEGGSTETSMMNADFMNMLEENPGAVQQFFAALGGIVPDTDVEIEGDEVLGLPGGDTVEVRGPSHEQGGIDAKLPPGTNVFSDRIKIDGLTMADRKKKRTKKQIALQKQQEANIYDSLVRNALNRTMQVNDKEEEFDMNLQLSAGEMLDADTGKVKAAFGTKVGDEREKYEANRLGQKSPLLEMLGEDFTKTILDAYSQNKNLNSDKPLDSPTSSKTSGWFENDIGVVGEYSTTEGEESKKKKGLSDFFNSPGSPTFGDMLGMYGNLRQGRDALQNTLEMRAGDTPNINPFENYGKDTLRSLEESKRGISGNRDNKLKDLEARRRAISSRNRNSARGINTMRGLDLAGDLQASMIEGNIIDQYFSQLSGANASIADAQMGIDQVVMGGEGQRDIEDRQDRAAFYSNLAQNKKDIAKGYSQTGKNLNEIKARGINANFLDNMAEHVSADIMTGEISLREGLTVVPDNQSKLSVFESSKGWEKLNMSEKEWSALKPSVKYKKIMEFMGAEETPKK